MRIPFSFIHHRYTMLLTAALIIAMLMVASAAGQERIKLNPQKKINVDLENLKYNVRLPSKTSVKVWNGRNQPGKEFFACIEEITIDSKTQDLNWWFQWSTGETGVARALYQVSLFPFQPGFSTEPPPGLMASDLLTDIPAPGAIALFRIDLKSVLPSMDKPPVRPKPTRRPMVRLPTTIRRTQQPKTTQPSTVVPLIPASGQLKFRRTLPLMKYAPEGLAVTLYIRIVTLDASGNPKGVPSEPAIIHYGNFQQTPVNYYTPPNAEVHVKQNNPCVHIVEYKPFHDYASDWCYHFVVTRDMNFPGMAFKKGDKLYLPPNNDKKSVMDYIEDAVGSLINLVSSAVNWVSNAYNSVKAKALELAISVAKNTVGCGQECQTAFSFALDYGLMAMGMPPSIPNFDEFSRLGKDYLVKKIAEESGLPESAVREGMDYFQGEIENAANGSGSSAGWLRPDPDYMYTNAILTIEVWNPTNKDTDKAQLLLEQAQKMFYFDDESNRYMTISVPPLAPGEKLQIPMILTPNSIQYTHKLESMLQRDWINLAAKGTQLRVTTGSSYDLNQPYTDTRYVYGLK